MSIPLQPLPAGGRSREEIAQIEVDSTRVASGTVRLLLAFFLTAIGVVPVVEWAGIRTVGAEGAAPASSGWSFLAGLPSEIRAHVTGAATAEDSGLWRLVVSTNRLVIAALSGFERSLEAESLLGRSLRPPAQVLMTGWLGVGNERVYRGRDGWLFYRPDVEYITARGFLDPAQLRRRVAAASEGTAPRQPDPRKAIAQLRRDLDARGITLLVMPTPLKPGVHPEMLARRYADKTNPLQNPSYRAFVDDLRRDGVLVFDPSEALAAARRSGPQYLTTDTHWRPETMEEVAELLGGFTAAHVQLPVKADPAYRLERPEVRNTGDVARMLDLSDEGLLFPPETVWLRRVLQPDGSPWRPSRDADVLVLGDSFSNIYALESMGWGTSAGFAEQLSYTLRRPVDRLVQNDEGAFATRALLRRDPDRLDGKRVVIYQFAARELALGDWKMIPLPAQHRVVSPQAP
jgi:hypothetical protein